MDILPGCSNRFDLITQEEFNEGNPPDVIIHFYPDPGQPLKTTYNLCSNREMLNTWLQSEDNCFYVWVPNGDRTIDDSGHGGLPSIERVYKLFGNGRTDFIANNSFLRKGVSKYAAFPVYKDKQRVGKRFGISNLHGQAPGEKIYWIIPYINPEANCAMMCTVLEHYTTLKGGKLTEEPDPSKGTYGILEMIQKYNEKQTSKLQYRESATQTVATQDNSWNDIGLPNDQAEQLKYQLEIMLNVIYNHDHVYTNRKLSAMLMKVGERYTQDDNVPNNDITNGAIDSLAPFYNSNELVKACVDVLRLYVTGPPPQFTNVQNYTTPYWTAPILIPNAITPTIIYRMTAGELYRLFGSTTRYALIKPLPPQFNDISIISQENAIITMFILRNLATRLGLTIKDNDTLGRLIAKIKDRVRLSGINRELHKHFIDMVLSMSARAAPLDEFDRYITPFIRT